MLCSLCVCVYVCVRVALGVMCSIVGGRTSSEMIAFVICWLSQRKPVQEAVVQFHACCSWGKVDRSLEVGLVFF